MRAQAQLCRKANGRPNPVSAAKNIASCECKNSVDGKNGSAMNIALIAREVVGAVR